MNRLIALFFALATCSFGAINAVNGVTASTASNINGVTAPSEVNGQALVSAGGAVSLTYHTNATNGTDGTNFNFASLAIGAAGDRDYVIAVVYGRPTSNGGSISAITIGGTSATLIPNASHSVDDGGASSLVAFYYAVVAAGTTTTVDVTFNTTTARAAVSIYTIKGAASMTPYDFAVAGASATSANLNVDSPSGDSVVLAACYIGNTSDLTIVWSGPPPTERDELRWDTSGNASSASATYSSSATNTVTCSWTLSSPFVGVSVVIQ